MAQRTYLQLEAEVRNHRRLDVMLEQSLREAMHCDPSIHNRLRQIRNDVQQEIHSLERQRQNAYALLQQIGRGK